jgi:AraC-like DNA-binding protein
MSVQPAGLPIVTYRPGSIEPGFPVWLEHDTYRNLRGKSNAPVPHVHHMVEIGYIHRGYATFSIAEKYLAFNAGDICVIAPSEPHRAFFPKTSTCSWIYFDPVRLFLGFPGHGELLDTTGFAGPAFRNVFSGKEHPVLRAIVENMISELDEKRGYYQDQFRGHLLSLLVYLSRLRDSGDPHFSHEHREPKRSSNIVRLIGLALDQIHHHYAEAITCTELAKRACMSTTSFRRSFKQVVGSSPYEYLSACRISAAVNALQEGILRVEEIGAACGFEDPSAFRRSFKKRMGVAPARWKATKAKTETPPAHDP